MKKAFPLSNTILLILMLVCGLKNLPAQNSFRGSGNIITKTFALDQFDKVEITNLNARIQIQLGEPFAVSVKTDDNLTDILSFSVNNGVLVLKQENPAGKSWIEPTEINVTIKMPELSKLFNYTNANVYVKSFVGRYLGIENNSNGNITVAGKRVDQLDIINTGNGSVDTKSLESGKADVNCRGNGSVSIRTDNTFEASIKGNGDITNFGKGAAKTNNRTGNGRISTIGE